MTPNAQTSPMRLSALNPEHNLQDALTRLEAQVRRAPASAEHRWALAEFLCVLGQWERALRQLQAGAQLVDARDAQWHAKSQLLRGLIRAEAQRTEVFAGQLLPVPVIDRPQWMEDLARAIAANEKGAHAQADQLRRSALDAAPTCGGTCTRVGAGGDAPAATHTLTVQAFDWISDTDTRLGPVCEFIVAGGYRWLAYADIQSLSIEGPTSLLDLVWLPAVLQLRSTQAGARRLHGFLPTRYSGTENVAAEAGSGQRDALMQSSLTLWQDIGETGVFALGQKTLMTPQGDIPLLDVRALRWKDSP